MIARGLATILGYDDLEVVIYYDWQPEEPATLEYPGADEEVTITAICVAECCTDILSVLDSEIIITAYEKVNEELRENDE